MRVTSPQSVVSAPDPVKHVVPDLVRRPPDADRLVASPPLVGFGGYVVVVPIVVFKFGPGHAFVDVFVLFGGLFRVCLGILVCFTCVLTIQNRIIQTSIRETPFLYTRSAVRFPLLAAASSRRWAGAQPPGPRTAPGAVSPPPIRCTTGSIVTGYSQRRNSAYDRLGFCLAKMHLSACQLATHQSAGATPSGCLLSLVRITYSLGRRVRSVTSCVNAVPV